MKLSEDQSHLLLSVTKLFNKCRNKIGDTSSKLGPCPLNEDHQRIQSQKTHLIDVKRGETAQSKIIESTHAGAKSATTPEH